MNKVLLTFVLVSSIRLLAAESKEAYYNKVVDAIYLAEGGAKTKHPYGIVSIKVAGHIQARKVCYNTVRNNHARWNKAGRGEDFIAFLGKRYCPIGAGNDPLGLNKNWQNNVRKFLKKGLKKNI